MSTATLHTTKDDIVIELSDGEVPTTVANFIDLADGAKECHGPNTGEIKTRRFHGGLSFHRAIGGFIVRGGCPLGTGTGGPGYRFTNEFHPKLSFNRPYLLVMANAGPGANGSQFFVTVAPIPHLNRRYTTFSEAKDPTSQTVVDVIATVETNHRDRPTAPVVINSVILS